MRLTLQMISEALTLDERAKWKERGVQLASPVEKVNALIGQDFHYISFTSIEKLGLNPSTSYATPAGIYAYPTGDSWFKAAWAASVAGKGREQGAIPFATEQPFIQLFRVRTENRMVVIGKSGNAIENEGLVTVAWRKLNADRPNEVAAAIEAIDMRGWPINGDARRIWLVTMFMAMLEVNKRGKMTRALKGDNQHIARWTKLMLDLGIAGFEDRGSGTIHPNEPHQAIVFRTSDVEQIDTVRNPLLKTRAAIKGTSSGGDSTVSGLSGKLATLRDALLKLLAMTGIDDNESLTLGGRLGDVQTGQPYTINQIIAELGETTGPQQLQELFESWTEQIAAWSSYLKDDLFAMRAILGLEEKGKTTIDIEHTTKFKFVSGKLVMVTGKTRVEGGTLTMYTPVAAKAQPIVIPSSASSTLIDCNFEMHMLAPLNTSFGGTYKMSMEKCLVFFSPKQLKPAERMTIEQGDSDELRELVESILSIKLGIEVALDGEFIWEGRGQPTGAQNTIMIESF